MLIDVKIAFVQPTNFGFKFYRLILGSMVVKIGPLNILGIDSGNVYIL